MSRPVAVDRNGNVFFVDEVDATVKEIVAVNGSIPATNPTINTLGAAFIQPIGIAVDGAGNVFVADQSGLVQEMVAINGTIPASPTINTLGSGFTSPSGVAVDGAGNVFVADQSSGLEHFP
jgi:large repetitive protein